MILSKTVLILGGLLAFTSVLADDWPQWLGPQRDGVWRETGIIEEFPKDGAKIRWRVPVGAGYSGPSVAGGRVYLTDRLLKPGVAGQANPFDRGIVEGVERVLCLDAKDGKLLWKHEYDCPYRISYGSGPRAHPVIDGGKVYTLGAEGNLFCFDAESGEVIWSLDLNEVYNIPTPLWGFSAHPLVDGNKLICLAGGEGSVAIALDKNSGKEIWRSLSAKEPGYAPPVIVNAQGKRQLIVWHPQAVNGLDPETGEVYWTLDWEIRNALTIATPKMWQKDHLYLSAFYNGSRMLKFNDGKPGVTTVWQSRKVSEKDTEALHCLMSTPFVEEETIYGICGYGQLRGLDAASGARIWETLEVVTPDQKPIRWATAFLVKNGDRYFITNDQGELIIASLSKEGYKEISRAKLVEPTNRAAGRDLVWSHPAFANKAVYMRNDIELVCADLAR